LIVAYRYFRRLTQYGVLKEDTTREDGPDNEKKMIPWETDDSCHYDL